MKSSSLQGALLQLQTWVDSAETRLEELLSQMGSSRTELSRRLKECRVKKNPSQNKPELSAEQMSLRGFLSRPPSAGVAQDLQTETSSHQAAMDFVDHGCSTETDLKGRCEQNQLAEEQGALTQRWFRLQATLNCQVRV